MRIAIAGLGKATIQGHLPAIARLESEGAVELVGGADLDTQQRAKAETRLPGVPLFESAEEMLASIRCDALVVATEPGAHAELVALGLEQRLHVICEKPLVVTRSQFDRVAQLHARRPAQALVSVHQYRYSSGWLFISRFARIARMLRIPFGLMIEVERPSLDPTAVSRWRTNADLSGGMLADHGAHYLALAWTVDEHLDVLAGVRTWREGDERAGASIRLGPGSLSFRISTGASTRRGRIALHVQNAEVRWTDDRLEIVLGGRTVFARPVDSLANRSYVDALYGSFYRDLAGNLSRPAWRAHRTAEALAVGRALVGLLDSTPDAVATA